MSTRYVYDIYNTTSLGAALIKQISLEKVDSYPFVYAIPCKSMPDKISVKEDRDGNLVTFYDVSDTSNRIVPHYNQQYNYTDHVFDTSVYPYVIISLAVFTGDAETSSYSYARECYLLERSRGTTGAFWHVFADKSSGIYEVNVVSSDSSTNCSADNLTSFGYTDLYRNGDKSFYRNGGTISKGSTLLNTISSRTGLSSGAYYSGGWRWRVYKGSDTIDPLSVTYRENTLYSGEPVTVQVEARTPTYGGTISYQYQYSVDGGKTWANAGSKTTETSLEIGIPADAKQFQARVLASDNYGFTSTTYVNGPNQAVAQLKAYIGINGKARAVSKIYIGVNGKACEVIKGYIGVNGKARKFL